MKNEKLILESLQTLVANASKTNETLASFSAFIAKRLPGLSEKEKEDLIKRSASLLTEAKNQQKQVANIETALKTYGEEKKH